MDLQQAIKSQVHAGMMRLVETELERVEALLPQCPPKSPDHAMLLRALAGMYGQLNRLLATACLVMGYPPRQWEWKDSQPLTEVAKAYPVVETTEWYQRQLAAVMMEPPDRRPWLDLEMFNGEIDLGRGSHAAPPALLSRDTAQRGTL